MFAKARLNEFDVFINSFMQEHDVPGMTIAIAKGEELLFSKAYGYRNLEDKVEATTDTIFGVASITKSITAIAIAQLAEQGKFSFDDPVTKILPDFCMPGGSKEEVTVHHLLTHTSGMPPLPFLGLSFRAYTSPDASELTALLNNPQAGLQMAADVPITYTQVIKAIGSYPRKPFGRPGECLNYSNECYGLLSAIVKEASGVPFAEYVKQHILRPLGMKRTMISFEEMFEYEEVTDLYTKTKEGLSKSRKWPCAPGFQGAGRIKSCCTDLIRIFQMYAGKGAYKGTRILAEETVATNIGRGHRYALKDHYAHGLMVHPDYHGVTLVTHGGAGKGISSHGGFVPENQLSAVVLCNLSGVPVVKAWMAAVNLALGLPLDTPRQTYTTTDWAPAEMERFVGNYKSAEGGGFEIFIEEGELKIKQVAGTAAIKRLNETMGLLGIPGQQQEIRFYLSNETPQAWGVGLGVRIIPRAE